MPRKVPSHLQRVTIRDPKTGQTQTHTRQNATDRVRHDGWQFVNTAADTEETTLADGRKVTGENHGDADTEARKEARAKSEQDDGADAPEVRAEADGVARNEDRGGIEPGASESDKEVVSELDELRARAGCLGVTVDKRWGLKRLRKEIDSMNAAL
jgi:hypothetical protein